MVTATLESFRAMQRMELRPQECGLCGISTQHENCFEEGTFHCKAGGPAHNLAWELGKSERDVLHQSHWNSTTSILHGWQPSPPAHCQCEHYGRSRT